MYNSINEKIIIEDKPEKNNLLLNVFKVFMYVSLL